jgi:hypothetical protein
MEVQVLKRKHADSHISVRGSKGNNTKNSNADARHSLQ